MVTAWRLWYYFSRSDTYSSVYGTGPSALKFSDQILNFGGPAPPFNQWRTEVEGWFQTSLAKIQAYAVEYTSNTANLGQHGFVGFPQLNGTTHDAWMNQCSNQKIRNTGNYQTFSFFGLIFTASVGCFIIVLALCLRHVVDGIRRLLYHKQLTAHECAYVADDKYQTQRMLFENLGHGTWQGCLHGSPWCSDDARIPNPVNDHGIAVRYPPSIKNPASPATSTSTVQPASVPLQPTRVAPQPDQVVQAQVQRRQTAPVGGTVSRS